MQISCFVDANEKKNKLEIILSPITEPLLYMCVQASYNLEERP